MNYSLPSLRCPLPSWSHEAQSSRLLRSPIERSDLYRAKTGLNQMVLRSSSWTSPITTSPNRSAQHSKTFPRASMYIPVKGRGQFPSTDSPRSEQYFHLDFPNGNPCLDADP